MPNDNIKMNLYNFQLYKFQQQCFDGYVTLMSNHSKENSEKS